MNANYFGFRVGMHVVPVIAFMLSSCASMESSKEELGSIGQDEGIVVGSVLLTLAQGETNESGWAFLKGRKAGDLEYEVAFSKKKDSVLPGTTYTLPAIPGKEAFFVKKLPAGNYQMVSIGPTGFLAPTLLRFPLDLSFKVTPQKTTYIGKLVVVLPDRLGPGGRFRFSVQDAQLETVDKLRNDYPSIGPVALKQLAGRDEGPSVVPGNTVASPALQRDTLTIVIAIDGAEDKTCTKRAIVNTESIKKPANPNDTGEERWIVDRCGKTVPYLVTFTPSARGGTDIGVRPDR